MVHLRKRLVETPVIMVEAIHSTHNSSAMAAARSDEELACCGIVNNFQELVDLGPCWVSSCLGFPKEGSLLIRSSRRSNLKFVKE